MRHKNRSKKKKTICQVVIFSPKKKQAKKLANKTTQEKTFRFLLYKNMCN